MSASNVLGTNGSRPDQRPDFAGRPLRMGILCESTTFEAWQAACIRKVLELGFVEPALLVLDEAPPEPRRRPLHRRLGGLLTSRKTVWNLFQRAFVRRASLAAVPTDLEVDLGTARRLPCLAPKRGAWAREFTPDEIARIREQDLDFLLRFAFNIIKGEIHAAARLGVWSYHHDDLDVDRGQPACFWALDRDAPVQGVTLQRLTDGIDNGIVLARGWYPASRHSYVRRRDAALFASAGMVAHMCRQLHEGAGSQAWAAPHPTKAPIRTVPGNLKSLAFCAKLGWRKARNAWTTMFRHGVWNVGLIDAPIHSLLACSEAPPARWLPRPPGGARGGILADPFGRDVAGRITLLCEQADTPEGKGRIVALEWPDARGAEATRRALELPHHLSYPFLLEDGGEAYCVPESSAAREVGLWRAVEFPHRWERITTLVQGVAALDATLVRWEHRWWLFAATKAPEQFGSALELHAWYASELRGPFAPHRLNPIKADVRSTRPAGTPFVHESCLYRPAQDCSTTYGGAVALCRVDRLGPSEFQETVVQVVQPNRKDGHRGGLHTLSTCGGRTLIDGKRITWLPGESARRLWARLRRRRGP